MRNSCMTERQPKMRQRDMQFTFWNNAISRFRDIGEVGFEPIVVAPFDAELLGTGGSKDQFSWNNSFATQQTNEISGSQTPSEYLAAHSTQQIVEPAASTWGENGHLAVWLDPSNAWIIRNSMRQPCGYLKSREGMRQRLKHDRRLRSRTQTTRPRAFAGAIK